MTHVFLVRHGATEWNEMKRAQGQADIELNDEGRKQAIHAAAELADVDVTAVYASDLKRAVDTAQAIAERHGVAVVTDAALREIDQGDWQGLSVDEIRKGWPGLWGPARHYSPRPNGESPAQVRRRALAVLRAIVEEHPHGGVVIVSHGGTIRWVSAEVLGYDDRRSARVRGLGNGGVVAFDARLRDGRLELSNFKRLDGNTPDLDDPND